LGTQAANEMDVENEEDDENEVEWEYYDE